MPHPEPEPPSEHPQTVEQGPLLAPVVPRRVVATPARLRILAVVEESPGLGFRELVRRLDVASGTVAHHVRVLVRRGLVWTTRHDGRLLHFAGAPPDEVGRRAAIEAHVLDDLDRALLALVRESPRAQKDVLAHFAEVARSTVQQRLRRLVLWGFLILEVRGRFRVYSAS